MEKRAVSGRGEPIPSILKKSKKTRSGDFVDKSTKLKREKNNYKKGDVNIPLPQGCTPLMYACQQANFKSVLDSLNKDVSPTIKSRVIDTYTHKFGIWKRKIIHLKWIFFVAVFGDNMKIHNIDKK